MTLTSKGFSLLLLAGLVVAIAVQLGEPPGAVLLLGAVTGLAALPVLHLRWLQSPTAHMLCWMVLLAMHGWLFGLRQDFGPYGLLILGSWCSTAALEGLPAIVLAKASLAPSSHLFMLLFGFVGMLIAVRRAQRPLLRCCAMMLLAMPLALGVADTALLLLLGQTRLEAGLLMSLLMLSTMTLAGWITAWLIAQVLDRQAGLNA